MSSTCTVNGCRKTCGFAPARRLFPLRPAGGSTTVDQITHIHALSSNFCPATVKLVAPAPTRTVATRSHVSLTCFLRALRASEPPVAPGHPGAFRASGVNQSWERASLRGRDSILNARNASDCQLPPFAPPPPPRTSNDRLAILLLSRTRLFLQAAAPQPPGRHGNL